jgi:predicted DNA-binding protein
MKPIEEDLSPQAKLWVERLSQEEGREPGRIISQIIESYMEMEKTPGEATVEKLVENLAHGPAQIVSALEKERESLRSLTERAENLLQILRLYCIQLHTRKNLGKKGEPIYTIKKKEKEIIFDDAPEDTQEEERML